MSEIARRLLPWFEIHGRKDLPWQQQVSAYRIWLSEIMLQQTQVATVIPYFERFIVAFPTLDSLANADLDRVLQCWAGLGYYARARNLHKAARIIQQDYQSQFPQTLEQLIALPGIGQSTAGAILSLAYGHRAAILDGNVKRVLSRLYQIEGWAGQSVTLKKLWFIAEQQTPSQYTANYNQALMDLGSMLCARSSPRCEICPLTDICQSYHQGAQADFPQPKPKKNRPLKHRWMLLHRAGNFVLLEKRPAQGIWGGLWSLPELEKIDQLCRWQLEKIGHSKKAHHLRESLMRHQFSHFELSISLAEIQLSESSMKHAENAVYENEYYQWISWQDIENYGMPAPVRKILGSRLNTHTMKNMKHIKV